MKKVLAILLTVTLLFGVCSIAANAALPPESYNSAKYFEDTENWSAVLLYAWDSDGNALCGEWPGVQLEAINPNQGCVTAYVINLPDGAAGFILNDGYYSQTVDVTDLGYDTYYLSGETDELGHYYVKHNDYILETTEPYTGTDPYPRKSTINLTDNFGWNTAYMYAWDENGSALCGEWPGTKVTNTSTNDFGERIFTITVPENAAGIIVNNGKGAQTEDITDFCHYDGYWMDGTKNELGHYKVTGYNEYIPDPTETEPTEGTTAQPQPCLYGFYNSQNFDSVYFYAWDNEGNPTFGEWPGTFMYVDRIDEATGWQVYRFYVPAGTAGIIINDGKGRQTEDITTLDFDAYWLPGTKDSKDCYLVEEYKGQEMTTTEPDTQPNTEVEYDRDDTILVTNNFWWSQGYMYAWDQDGNALCGEWPGTKIKDVRTNEYGEEMFCCYIPADAVGMIISNNYGSQTVDITDLSVDGYRMDGTTDEQGHYYVTGYDIIDIPTTNPTETTEPFNPGSFTLGDVTGDGIITVADATMVQEYAAEMRDFTPTELAAADTNRDGIVTVADATLIQQYAAEMIESF